ncbi:K02A2.6-like [Cordylochernes scorpioides]|uniref:RNA-directed DNA polymerase n=1 Tax=Cordylochernes scorpioides TaxID=51811 RepID=A0ABY6KQ32_9ARAC|nr:K02A2.6-like [Cordylochernes scorpioides]
MEEQTNPSNDTAEQTIPKQETTLEEEETSPPQDTSADPLTQIADALSKLLVARSPREIDVSPYDGTFEAQSFFDNFDAQADRTELTYTDRLRKLPCYLQGISQMTRIITTQYYWKGISKSIEKFVRSCHTCQIIKRPKDTIAGFSKYGHSKTYLHVIVDHLTRYAWTFPSKSTSTLTYIQTLKTVLQQGSPKRLLSDRAPAFTSEKFRKFLIMHALKKIAEKCEFPDLEDRLRDALVCGILNGEIQSMLLMNSMLTFKVAQEMALAHEAAVKNVAEIKDGKPQEEINVMGRAVKTSGRDINMHIDSGTGKNIISEKTYIETWVKSERPRIEKDSTKLVQWNRQRLSILGKIKADVKVNKINITMELLVVEGPGPNLIGREAFDQIGIGLEWINYGNSVCQITEEFMDVFKEKLGQYRGPPIHIKIKTLRKPTFLRARTLPYAIRPKVEEALRKMEEQGILTPVEFTRFATPIVPVLKRDGSIRICGDYWSTVNTIVESDTFPVPAAADLQVNLAGGKVFSKLDLKDAYQQLVVDEETAELLAINTHKGLFKWPEAIIMDHCTATATVRVLRDLFAVHGLPEQVVSDNGRMFVGHEFQEFLRINGIRHITSAPYHPQTNGQAERVVQTLKQLIRKNGWENISVTLPRALVERETTNSTIEKTFLATQAVSPLSGDKVVHVVHHSATRNGTYTAFIEVDKTTFKVLEWRGSIVVDRVILKYEESVNVCLRYLGFIHNSEP